MSKDLYAVITQDVPYRVFTQGMPCGVFTQGIIYRTSFKRYTTEILQVFG